MLTREDANTELALLDEWLVADGADVRKGEPICVVETSKASIEIEAPGEGTLLHLFAAGAEVEMGAEIALLAESEEERAQLVEQRARREPQREPVPAGRKATKKAHELAQRLGVDLNAIEKRGFVTEQDVEAWAARQAAVATPAAKRSLLAGIALERVTLPTLFDENERTEGMLEAEFLELLRADPRGFGALGSEEKCRAYRDHGAAIGDDVVLDEGAVLVSPRIVIEDRVRIGRGGLVICEDVVAIGALTHVGENLDLACRRAFVGAGVHAGRAIRIGGGGHRDPWAVLAIGDLTFVGDEVFVNVCRPVLIGREVFLTQRAMIVTHNIGHSKLEGFENRFAPVVLEDRAQVGLTSVVYAGCRIGEGAIVASSSYVVSDIPPGTFAIGVPAKATGHAQRTLTRSQQVDLAHELVADLFELLELRGHAVRRLEEEAGFELELETGRGLVVFVPRLDDSYALPFDAAEAVVLTLELTAGGEPVGYAVLDLLGRVCRGPDGPLLDAVREFSRKRGIRFEPGPWRYGGGLV